MTSIVPLVEGHGEVEAAGLLLRRLIQSEQRFDVTVARPFRVKRHRVVKENELERSLVQAVRARGAEAALLLLDADDDCPVELAQELLPRARRATSVHVSVVCASREFEGWFLAAKRSLRGTCGIRGDAEPPPNPDGIRDAKGHLTMNMIAQRRYLEVADQPALAAIVDLDAAEANSRSFQKLRNEVRRLLGAL